MPTLLMGFSGTAVDLRPVLDWVWPWGLPAWLAMVVVSVAFLGGSSAPRRRARRWAVVCLPSALTVPIVVQVCATVDPASLGRVAAGETPTDPVLAAVVAGLFTGLPGAVAARLAWGDLRASQQNAPLPERPTATAPVAGAVAWCGALVSLGLWMG